MPGEGRGLSSRPTQDVARDREIGQPSNSEKCSEAADGVTRESERADFHDGPEHSTLQSEAGYIDARPQSRQIDESLLQRTAVPYIAV